VRPAFLLALLVLLRLVLLAPGLAPADLILTYPFMDGDSYDWIANGLRLAGEDVRYSGRPPLLPLAIALLHRLSLLPWLPALLQGLFLATVLAFYGFAARLVSRRAAFVAALALLVNDSLTGLSLQVMADVPASCLLFLAARSFVSAGEEGDGTPRRAYLAGGLFAGLAALAQSAGLLWAPAAGATALAHRRRDLRSPWLWACLLAPVAALSLGSALQPEAIGGPGGIAREQWRLLSLHAGSAPFYLYGLASLLGIPGLLLAAAGAALAVRRARSDPARFLSLALCSALALFFVLLYDYQAKRFLVYGVWFAGLFVAEALERLRHRMAFAAAAALLLIGSALPLPTAAGDPTVLGLWPLPPCYAVVPAATTQTGSASLDFAEARCVRSPLASWLLFSHPYRAWEARGREAGFVRRDPAAFASDRAALFLYEAPSDGGGRYRSITRLSGALRKRVKFVPVSFFEPYWRWLHLAPAGPLADYALYRARIPGRAETWLLAVEVAGPLRRRLDRLAARSNAERVRAAAVPLAPARQKAEAIQRFVAGSDGFVALIPSRRRTERTQLYLPFVLETTELYVAEPGGERSLLDLFRGTPTLRQQRIGGAVVKQTEVLGRKTSFISYW
jgi:dolichyl-phosphate-mannose-protein mannosyltransferase